MNKPAGLIKGDKVGIFLPSSPVREEFRQRGKSEIEELGFIPVEADSILSRSGYTGKPPGEVISDLVSFLTDDSVKAVWAARGGYGSNRVLDALEFPEKTGPKVIIGSSDVSYLLWRIMDELNMPVFYGPMAYSTVSEKRYDRNNFLDIVSGNYETIQVGGRVLREGKVTAVVTGGCLSNLASLCGTPHFPGTRDRIVLLEDTGERPYRLDRMLWQLSECGFFTDIRGILFGEFPGCFNDDEEKTGFYRAITGYFKDYDYPVLYDMPFGHSPYTKTLPLGIGIGIDTGDFEGISIREKGVRP